MMHSIDIARTHEILARYRPIAPKPVPPQSTTTTPVVLENAPVIPPVKSAAAAAAAAARLHHLQPKACRSRKRGRAGYPCVSQKRSKTFVRYFPSPEASLPLLASKTAKLGLSAQDFSQGFPMLPHPASGTGLHGSLANPIGNRSDLLTLSLLPSSSSVTDPAGPLPASETSKEAKESALDLNSEPALDEKYYLLRDLNKPHVIVPRPVRPVGSSISVWCISEDRSPVLRAPVTKKLEEVEEEVESEVLPAVLSDSNNRVRLANSAYKAMVGQPECSWLDSMLNNSGVGLKAASKRINGEVMLDLWDSPVPVSSNGFSCRVKIEWACNGQKTSVNAPCDVIRLSCESKDYLFAWRFHTIEASDANYRA